MTLSTSDAMLSAADTVGVAPCVADCRTHDGSYWDVSTLDLIDAEQRLQTSHQLHLVSSRVVLDETALSP